LKQDRIVEDGNQHPVQTEESKTETKTKQKTGQNKVKRKERNSLEHRQKEEETMPRKGGKRETYIRNKQQREI
jgi:hypothetical protein